VKIGILASGSGTNLQALLDARQNGALGPAEIAAVGVNVPGCGAQSRAEKAGVPTFALDHKQFAERAAFDSALAAELTNRGVQAVVLAGFMRLLTSPFLSAFEAGVINIHPSLLPAFPGVRAQSQAFNYGVRFSGCTVHFVDDGMDTGPIIAQAVVPVLPDDDAEALRLRILAQEHLLLPAAVRALAQGRIHRDGRHVRVEAIASPPAAPISEATGKTLEGNETAGPGAEPKANPAWRSI